MAMNPGTVTVNATTAAVTSSGFAGDRYSAMYLAYLARLTALGASPPADIPSLVAIRQAIADAANESAAVVAYVKTNAETTDGETLI